MADPEQSGGGDVKNSGDVDSAGVLIRKIAAEFIGTLILVFMSTAGAIVDEKTDGAVTFVGVAACTGLAVMIVVMAIGHISGGHVNPAVTVAAATLRQLPWRQVPMYIGAQLTASICAGLALKIIFQPAVSGGVTIPTGGDLEAFFLEFIISFNLMFVITSLAFDAKAENKWSFNESSKNFRTGHLLKQLQSNLGVFHCSTIWCSHRCSHILFHQVIPPKK
ncbi:aquaporin NIP6-1-like isoform X3 [Dioscorea cayenensis subsp. rotundata]|uniref:Aquaporin NIP6-1-like isoform X3 n=1 Tax=Dioscorea cayennensis subsp. rotundata TaxID=55577 RepID=A0AB40BZS9_DIOCR|nr:aquaporin NIP6-1-like isoform X3 [Dioscorea cayenensis subsp. rotundata]